jgi:hypothetical protein
MNEQLNILEAIERARARGAIGIERVTRKAHKLDPDWCSSAIDWLRRYLLSVDGEFLTEEFSDWAVKRGCHAPHDGRAWGGIMRKAVILQIVVRVGYRPSPKSNMSPKCLWRRSF